VKIIRPWTFALACCEMLAGALLIVLGHLLTEIPVPAYIIVLCLIVSTLGFAIGLWTISLAVRRRVPGDRW
jgi:hypothetical protein